MALASGVRPGLALADARALIPALHVDPANPAADRACLADLADWARRWTPLTAIDGEGLVLDVAGCAHLLGGEDALMADAARRFAALGFRVQIGFAPNPVAAAALALAGVSERIGQERLADALNPLPLQCLGLLPELVAGLGRVGLRSIGDLASRPRAPLARRFGQGLIDRLDQAYGVRGAPITPRLTSAPYVSERRFTEPLTHREDVRLVARDLAVHLASLLERHGEGARAVELSLFKVDGGVLNVPVATSRPLRDARLIADLIGRKLEALGETLDVGFGLDVVRLSVTLATVDAASQIDLDARHAEDEAVRRMVDRIGARLGAERLVRLVPLASHWPEHAACTVPAAQAGDLPSAAVWLHAPVEPESVPERPVRLFSTPELVEAVAGVPDGPPVRFRWRRMLHEVAHAEGPERIAPEWWRPGASRLTRDYFRVEDANGARFWLYRDGLYEREETHPRWYLHGVFA